MERAALRAFDVVVVGGGAAGLAAAREAALAAGAPSVALVSAGPGATEQTAGWLAGRARAPAWCEGAGLRTSPARYLGLTGVVRDAQGGLASLLPLDELAEGAGPVAVLDLAVGVRWSAPLLAHALERHLARPARVVRAGDAAPQGATCLEVARRLDTDALLEALATSLAPQVRGCAGLLVPPVLGLLREDRAARLRALLGVPVGETGGAAGDATALRLARALARAVPAQVTRLRGFATVREHERGARVLVAEREGGEASTVLRARAVVLATGGLAGGGVALRGGAFVEPTSEAPLFAHEREAALTPRAPLSPSADRGLDPQRWFAPDDDGATRAASVGLRRDARGRVLGPDGLTALHDWLFAAGALVGAARGPDEPGLTDVLDDGARVGREAAASVADVA